MTRGSAGRGVPAGRIVAVMTALTALAPLSVDIYTPALPLLQAELGGSDALVQATVTGYLLGIAVGQLMWGPLSDRLGRKRVVLAGILGWTAASVVSALAVSPEMLALVRVAAGVCGAAGIVVARSIVRDVSADAATTASRIGVLAMVAALAPILAPPIGAAVAAVGGWRADFVALAVFGGVVGVAVLTLVPETLPPADRRPRGIMSSLVVAWRDSELRWAALSLGAFAVGFYAYVSTASFVVEREYGMPPFVFALVFGSNAVAMLAANIVFRRLVRRRHPASLAGVGLVVTGAAGAAIAVAAAVGAPGAVVWVASAVFTAGTGFVLPGSLSWGQLTATASGAASALTGALQFAGGAAGSPLTGLVGPTAAHLGILIVAASVVALGLWALARRARREPGSIGTA